MNHETKSFKPLLVLGLLAVGITFSAWQSSPAKPSTNSQANTPTGDTTQPRKHGHDKNEYRVTEGGFEEAMRKLDEEMAKLDQQMKKMDFSKMEKELEKAQKQLEKLDFSKIEREVNESMRKVDWEKMQHDVNKAMKEAELQMKEVNLEKMHANLEKMKLNLDKQQMHMNLNAGKIRKQVEEGMERAKEGMEKAKVEMQNLKDFTDELEKDGLISKKKGYLIKVQDGSLFINGKKQSNETYEKYKPYYKKDKFTIKSDGENTSSL